MKLRDIANIKAGYSFRGKIPEKKDSSLKVVQMKNVSLKGGVRWSECQSTEIPNETKSDYLSKGDILIVARGNHYFATLVDKTDKYFKAIASPHFFVVSLVDDNVLPEFLAWQLNQPKIQRYLSQSSEGTLTKSIRRNVLENIEVVIPSRSDQKVISSLLTNLRHEQKVIEKLSQNTEKLISAIAQDLILKHQ